jgi:hypothetical protein
MSKKGILVLLLCIFLLAAGTAAVVTAQESGGFTIPWWTVDSGGDTSTGGTYELTGTIGQADTACAAGGDFALKSGFWQGCPLRYGYLPLINR